MSSDIAKKFHSVNFGNKNTWDDWKLIPIKRPVIEFPEPKTISVDIPSGDGEIDLSEAITGYPVYSNRKGSLSFRFVDNPSYRKVLNRRNEIASFLHGRTMQMILDEEPEYFYTGRFQLNDMSYKGKSDYADVTISYNVKPYKYSITTSASDDWLWDPFNFETGVIQKAIFASIAVDTDGWYFINNLHDVVGDSPVTPTVTVTDNTGNVTIRLYDSVTQQWSSDFVFTSGAEERYSFVITKRHTRMAFKGHATVSINFRTGRL